MASIEPSVLRVEEAHAHVAGEVCPLCDQPIPPDKLVEIQQRERERAETQRKQLRQDFDKEKAAAVAKTRKEVEAAMDTKLATTELEKNTVTEQLKALQAEQTQARADSVKREAAARVAGKTEGENAMKAKLATTELEKNTVTEQLKALQAEQTQAKADSVKREAAARLSGKTEGENAMKAKLEQTETAKKAVEEQLQTVKGTEQRLADERLQKALHEQREFMEKDKTEAVQKEQTKAFKDRQKTEADLAKLQRQVKKQRADELGEEAELDLCAALRGAFDDDQFQPIDKGVPGADLWQDVVHGNDVCGRIVYDSKNRGAWRNEYVDKLKTDQLNADGDYAVLATRVFPAGIRQLHVQDGVFLAHPARVVALVTMLREQLIQTHRLKLSTQERETKTAALYEFINSERCHQIFEHHETLMETMLELDADEKKRHDQTWTKRGQHIKKAQRAIQVQLLGEINRIIVDDLTS